MNEDYRMSLMQDREDEARERIQAEEARRDELEMLTAERIEVVEDMGSEDWFALLEVAAVNRGPGFVQARLNDLAVLSQKIEALEVRADA